MQSHIKVFIGKYHNVHFSIFLRIASNTLVYGTLQMYVIIHKSVNWKIPQIPFSIFLSIMRIH